MNTLATRYQESSLSPRQGHEQLVHLGEDRQGSLFLVGSLALHLGLVVAFAWLPAKAHASAARDQLVEIDFVEAREKQPELPVRQIEPEPKTALPLGRLDAPVRSTPAPSAPSTSEVPSTSDTAEAPEVLTVDNPYASADAAVFTSGSATRNPVRIEKHVAQASPQFGVEGGSAHPDADKTRELRGWYAEVQAQLARLGTRNYPRRALKLGQQGTAKVTVTIDESGNLIGARLASGSGVASLDEAALKGVQSITKVAAPPSGAGTNQLTIPVTFRIN